MADVFDAIVIGSGFGGSVMAARLTEAGKKVLVLERGPWRDTLPTRTAGIKRRKKLPSEPLWVCRRLQLLSRMEHHEQDNEQVFP